MWIGQSASFGTMKAFTRTFGNVHVTWSTEEKVYNMISFFIRSLNSDYKGSGFDRGHLAAAGNHKASQKHCEDTFFLTNMAPQVGV